MTFSIPDKRYEYEIFEKYGEFDVPGAPNWYCTIALVRWGGPRNPPVFEIRKFPRTQDHFEVSKGVSFPTRASLRALRDALNNADLEDES